MILPHIDEKYLDRLQSELLAGLMRASHDKETGSVVILSGEVVTAAIGLLAMAAATSKGVDTPAKLRAFSDECAKRIRANIRHTQEKKAAGKLDWLHTVHASERH